MPDLAKLIKILLEGKGACQIPLDDEENTED